MTSGTTSVSKLAVLPELSMTDAMPYFRRAMQPGDKVRHLGPYHLS